MKNDRELCFRSSATRLVATAPAGTRPLTGPNALKRLGPLILPKRLAQIAHRTAWLNDVSRDSRDKFGYKDGRALIVGSYGPTL